MHQRGREDSFEIGGRRRGNEYLGLHKAGWVGVKKDELEEK